MAASSAVGTRGQLQFSALEAPDMGADETALSNQTAELGTRRVGTTAERNALSGAKLFEGLLWADTTDGVEYRFTSGAWAPAAGKPVTGGVTGQGGFATVSGTWVRRTGSGIVHATVALSRATGIPSGVPIAIMNAGFRPLQMIEFAGVTSEGGTADSAFIRIETSGNIVVFNPGANNQKVSFAVTFPGA